MKASGLPSSDGKIKIWKIGDDVNLPDFLFLLQLLKAFHLFRLQELVDAEQLLATPAMHEYIYLAHQTLLDVTVVTHHDERAVEI